jgi:hypothetical protein
MCDLLNGDKTLEEILENDDEPTKEQINNACIEYDRLNLNEDMLNDFKLFVLLETITTLYGKHNIQIEEDDLSEYKELLENKEYDSLFRKFNKNFNGGEVVKLGPYNPIVQFKKTIGMFKQTDYVIDIINNGRSREEYSQSVKKLFDYLTNVSLIFVPDEYLPNAGISLNSSYITNKIVKSFERIFDIGHKTEFNDMELGEQISIIKEILERVFTDTKLKYNDPSVTGSRQDRSPLFNRVFQTVLIDKETKDPYYLMIVRNSANEKQRNEGLVPIIFDLKRNTISKNKPITDIYDSFYIIKDSNFKLMIEQIEDGDKSIK